MRIKKYSTTVVAMFDGPNFGGLIGPPSGYECFHSQHFLIPLIFTVIIVTSSPLARGHADICDMRAALVLVLKLYIFPILKYSACRVL